MSHAAAQFSLAQQHVTLRYDLGAEEVAQLTGALLDKHPTSETGRYACYVIDGENSYSNLGRSVEAIVFESTFGNDAATMQEEYGIYEHASSFFLIVDKESRSPVGVLRVIANSPAGLKTIVDIEKSPLGISLQEMTLFHGIDTLDNCWDIGTLAVVGKERGSASDFMVSTALYRTLYVEAVKGDVEHLISIIDQRAYESLQFLGVRFVPMVHSDYFSYLDSPKSMAVYGHVTDFLDAHKSYEASLTPRVREMIGPYLSRLMSGTDVPEPVTIRNAGLTVS